MIADKKPGHILEQLAGRAYALVAEHYPVCSASDEFYFFPQALPDARHWSVWDDFSPATIELVADRLAGFEEEIARVSVSGMSESEVLDQDLLSRSLRTLREQLSVVASHSRQPTFHLTVLAAGLSEALASQQPEAWRSRVAGTPDFLRRAADCLEQVPELFLRLGFEMLRDLQAWLRQLQEEGLHIGELPGALHDFAAELKKIKALEDYRLPQEVFEQAVARHLDCGVGSDAAWALLDEELQAMESLLRTETDRLVPGRNWLDAVRKVPFTASPRGGLLELYRQELLAMEAHCRRQAMIPDNLPAQAALKVAEVPPYLSAIRASDAYSASPGHPPRGGTFFVMEQGRKWSGRPGRSLEYRMTAAHEVWPGHHLLDACRWNLDRPLRRALESPLFYEGWACLAEELMARTGYLDGPWDRFLLAKRRAERAARGMVDLGLQSGRITFGQAVEALVRVGFSQQDAQSVIPKYLLRPGYQVCYTLGLKQGLNLLRRFNGPDVGAFARYVLGQGEVGFERLGAGPF